MKRILFGAIATFAFCGTTFGQSSSQNKPVADKHYGSVCARLTTDSQCRVCAKEDTGEWRCYSHSVWKEIPGTALPLPEPGPASKRETGSGKAESSPAAGNSCPDWSPKFDEIRDPEVTNVLRQEQGSDWNDKSTNDVGALQSALQQVQDLIPRADQSISDMGGGDFHSMDPVGCKQGRYRSALGAALCERLNEENMLLTVQGTLDIARCRLSHPSASSGPDHLAEPEGAIEENKEVESTFGKAKDIAMDEVKKANEDLSDRLEKAKGKMKPSDLKKYENEIDKTQTFLDGFNKVIDGAKYTQDIGKCMLDKDCHDIVADIGSDGFSYVLKKLAPSVSEVWEGGLGAGVGIVLDSETTATPQQDFDPMTAINDPAHYTFQQREQALEMLYQSANRHPEVWNQSKLNWLYGVSEQLYNSPDNPNINLTPK